ncbi:hypothetical protein TWF718_005681 [Orbilia javanica]|uniref:Uncharacterized protein n=1 Tax=Orbilia javanica TaxID=47235 RepID=A0AAN8RED4_9PEZI
MLPVRHMGAKAPVWRATTIQSSSQVRLLASVPKTSLRKSIENNTRVNTILRVQSAVASTSSKLTLDSLTTDDQRRDYLWSRRQQILRILPGREWKRVFAIARRLFEFNYLVRPPPDKEFKKIMLDNYGELLAKLEQTPMWLTAEIKMLESRDRIAKEEAESKEDAKDLKGAEELVDKSVPESPVSSEEGSVEQDAVSTADLKASDQVLVMPNSHLLENAQEENVEDESRYRNLVISPVPEPIKTTAPPAEKIVEKPVTKQSTKPAEKPVEQPAEKPTERTPEKKATEPTKEKEKEAPPIQIIFPDYKKVIRPGGREEAITVEKLNQLEVPEDKTTGAFEILQKLSKTLVTENIRPDLKPVSYPNQATYALLAEATTLLEEACFEFIKKRAPSVTSWPEFDCPEAQEYKRWVELIIKLGKEHSKDGFKLPPKFVEGVSYGDIIRNSAAHRLPIHAPKLRELLRRSRMWVDSLDVPEVSQKFERLEQSAAEIQTELEDELQPVVNEIRDVLSKIKGRWEKIKRLEEKILEIQKSIREEKGGIELEERNIEGSLQKAQSIRHDRGQKFERQKFRDYVQRSLVEVSEPKEETGELLEKWPADEDILEERPVETKTESPDTKKGIELPDTKKGIESPAPDRTEKPPPASEKTEGSHPGTERPKLARDYHGGLVAFETDVLADVEDISFPTSKRTMLKPKDTTSKPEPSKETTLEKGKDTKGKKSTEKKGVKEDSSGEEKASKEAAPRETESSDSKKSKKVSFEGPNLSRDSDPKPSDDSAAKWYNPLSWFK